MKSPRLRATLRVMDIIFDTDAGIDDALAYAAMLASDKLAVKGITTTYGNVATRQATSNMLSLSSLFGCDAPVAEGALGPDGSIYEASPRLHKIHGANGLGDVDFPAPKNCPSKGSALDLLSQLAQSSTLVAVGPLTNVAAFIKERPGDANKLERIVIMGGALRTSGNVTRWAEANIHKDPEAARTVFTSGLDVYLLPLDVTERMHLRREDTGCWNSEAGRLYKAMLKTYFDFHGGSSCFLHDPAVVAYLLSPGSFITQRMKVDVICTGDEAGRLVEGRGGLINVAANVDSKAAESVLKNLWKSLFSA